MNFNVPSGDAVLNVHIILCELVFSLSLSISVRLQIGNFLIKIKRFVGHLGERGEAARKNKQANGMKRKIYRVAFNRSAEQ